LDGKARTDLLALAAQIHGELPRGNVAEVAKLGHQLYRAIFCLDASDAKVAHGVQTWVHAQAGMIDRVEFLSDAPGVIPLNVLIDDTTGDVAQKFWGVRYSLGAGRRVNVLRQAPVLDGPTPLAVLDSDLAPNTNDLMPQLRDRHLVHSLTSLADETAKSTPDILWLLVRFENGKIRLGSDTLDLNDLRAWIDSAQAGNPEPIIILSASGASADQAAWTSVLGSASALFSGLVANESLLPADLAYNVGHAITREFLEGKTNLGTVLQSLRTQHGPAAMAFTAFCPPQIRVCPVDTVDAPQPENTLEAYSLPLRPYHPFAAYDATERALFYGREMDVQRTAAALDRSCTQAVLLHGSPAVGKTSFLQAGLLPYLEQESIGFRVLRDRTPGDSTTAEKDYPILILRATNDLAGQFADALSAFCAQPLSYTTPTGATIRVDLPSLLNQAVLGTALPSASPTAIQASSATTGITNSPDGADDEVAGLSPRDLWVALRDNKALLGQVLGAVTKALPFELVIAVDQGEELLTLVRTSQQIERRTKAIDMLQGLSEAAPRCKIIYTLRSQSLAQIANLFSGGQAPPNWRAVYLRPLNESEIVDALQWPTNRAAIPYTSDVPFPHYGFAFEEGLAQKIVREAIAAGNEQRVSPLPIVHAVGWLLYEKQVLEKKQNVLRGDDLKAFDGVKNALSKALDQKLQQLPVANISRTALRNLISSLSVSQADGTVTRDMILAADLKNYWESSGDKVETVVNQAAEEQGLFEIQNLLVGGHQDLFVSLPQDSLAQLGKKIEAERDQKKAARSNTIDVLWIMIPLVFLAAAVTFWFTRNYINSAGPAQQVDPRDEKIAKAIEQRAKQVTNEIARRPLYYGLIAQADLALKADNALRTRQLLLSQPAMRSFNDEVENQRLPDLRGFEWRYLWKQLNRERFLLQGHRGAVAAVAVSADGKWAASASERSDSPDDAGIRIWNLATGEIIASIVGPKIAVHALAFAPDGKTLASAGSDKVVRVWELPEFKTDFVAITKDPKTLIAHEGAVNALAFGKDGQTLASAGADKLVILWDVASGKPRHTLKDHGAAVHALAFHGGKLASAGAEADCLVWDAESGKKLQSIKTNFASISSLSISSDGKNLCTGGTEKKYDAEIGTLRTWSLDTGKETGPAIQHGTGVLAVAYHPDGKSIASGGKDHVVRLWDVATGKQQERWLGHLGAVQALAFAKDAALVSGSVDRTVKVWTPGYSDVIAAHADWVQCLALDGKNTMVASGSRDGSVKLWDVATTKLLHQLPAHNGAITSIAFSHHKDKRYLAVGTRSAKNDGEIKVWQIDRDDKAGVTSKERYTFKEHTKGITALAFCPNPAQADLLVSGSADHTVKVWDIEAGKEKETYRGHKDEVRCIAFGPDGKTFASGGKDAVVCVQSITGKDVWTLTDLHLNSIESVSLFQFRVGDGDGEGASAPALWTGSADQTARVWVFSLADGGRVDDRRQLRHFHTHTQTVTSVVQSDLPNGMMATAGADGSIKLYDIANERFTLLGHQGPVRALALARDHSFLVSAGNDGTVRFWRAPKERGMNLPEKK